MYIQSGHVLDVKLEKNCVKKAANLNIFLINKTLAKLSNY